MDVETDMHTGRMPCQHDGADQCYASKAEEHQRWSANHYKIRESHETDSPSQSSGETNSANA